jgi:hypothetical protein
MKWTPWLFGSLTAALIAGCGGDRGNNNDTAATPGAETESGTMQGGPATSADTSTGAATGGTTSDTARTGSRIRSDTAAGARDTMSSYSDSGAGANY